MDRKKIILVGGGGHCRSCIDVIETNGKYHIEGILDIPEKLHQKLFGYSIIGTDDDLPQLAASGFVFLITAGHIKTPTVRKKLFDRIKALDGICETIVAPTATVSRHAILGEGTIIMHHAFVNAGAVIGSNCIINTQSVIEHDVNVGDHSHISTTAVLNGGVTAGTGVFIGSNTVVNQNIKIADHIIIGSGSVVIRDLTETGIYAGNKLKKIS